jgi:uncharacterized protein
MAGAAIAAPSLASLRRRAENLRGIVVVALLGLVASSMLAIAAPVYPELTGRVTDEAGLLSASDKTEIESELAAIEQTSTDQIAVVTVNSLQGYSIEDYGIGLARKWGIGQKGKDNGILLIIAPNDRKVRIEVGRRLEPLMTDTMSSLIIQNAILPKFRRGDFAGGIKDAVRDIKTVLLGDPEEVKRRAAGGRTPEDDPTAIIALILFFSIFALIMWLNYRSMQAVGPGGRRRPGVIIIPSGSGSWGGGWSGGGGDSGGGWSGGGGDFGGGGASGSW